MYQLGLKVSPASVFLKYRYTCSPHPKIWMVPSHGAPK